MPSLTPSGCRLRRERLQVLLHEMRLDAAVLSDRRDVYYFTGTFLPPELPAVLFLPISGRNVLFGPEGQTVTGVDDYRPYSWSENGTRHPDPLHWMLEAVQKPETVPAGRRVAIQGESIPWGLAAILQSRETRETWSRSTDTSLGCRREKIRMRSRFCAPVSTPIWERMRQCRLPSRRASTSWTFLPPAIAARCRLREKRRFTTATIAAVSATGRLAIGPSRRGNCLSLMRGPAFAATGPTGANLCGRAAADGRSSLVI